MLRERPRYEGRDALGAPAGELHRERAEPPRQRCEGPERLDSSALTAGMLTAFATSSLECRGHLLGDDQPGPVLSLLVDAARCGVTTTLSSSSSGPV